MIPDFEPSGLLKAGIHLATWAEVVDRFGYNLQRELLLAALKRALEALHSAGCLAVYLDGSFVTAKAVPGDYDLCWSLQSVDPNKLDPVLLDFGNRRRAMKAKYQGDLFPAEFPESKSGKLFLNFFQTDKDTGDAKGVVLIDLRRFP